MPTATSPKLDADVLRGFAARRHISHATWADCAGVTVCALRRQLERSGGIGWASADTLASALGLHPVEVWGDAWWSAEHALELEQCDTDAAWREVERSHAQWIAQRERFALLRLEVTP